MQQKNSLQRRTQSTKTTFVSIKTHANSKEIQESIFFLKGLAMCKNDFMYGHFISNMIFKV